MRRLLHALALGSLMLAATPVFAREAGPVTHSMTERGNVRSRPCPRAAARRS